MAARLPDEPNVTWGSGIARRQGEEWPLHGQSTSGGCVRARFLQPLARRRLG